MVCKTFIGRFDSARRLTREKRSIVICHAGANRALFLYLFGVAVVKRRFFALLSMILLILPCLEAWSADGVMWGEKDFRCISTQWFDIIYPSKSWRSAKTIYECADRIYCEICQEMGTSPQFRMTVTITPATDSFNAYFTNFSINHIVLYDTVPEESLAVFSNDMEGTFRHELTHAVTINMRNKFWTALDSVFGDAYNFGCYITMPQFLKEGASVFEESRSGEGRLNDGFYLHMVRQSLVQGEFPSYTEIAGARDVYPGGNMSYGFGGPFVDWLQREYGKDRYVEFWYEGINGGGLTYEIVFKKVYGISLGEAWESFRRSIQCPAVAAGADDVEGVEYYQRGQTPGAVYTSLSAGRNGITYAEKKSSSVWFAPWENGGLGKSRKLFTKRGLQFCRQSRDGRFMAVGCSGIDYGNPRNELFVYDMEKKSFTNVPELSLRDACIVDRGDRPLLCAVKTRNGSVAISVWEMVLAEKDGGVKGIRFLREQDFALGTKVFSLVDASDGKVGFIQKDENGWSVCLMDSAAGGDILQVRFGQGMALRGLSPDEKSLADGKIGFNFSWATRDVMPRLGNLVLDGDMAHVSLMDGDISGGVYFPCSGQGEIQYAYIGNFVSENRLVLMKDVDMGFSLQDRKAVALGNVHPEKDPEFGKAEFEGMSRKYVGGFERGMIVPFASIPVFGIYGTRVSGVYFPGVSYLCNDAWDGKRLSVMAGVNPGEGIFASLQDKNFEAAIAAQLSGGSSTSLFNYSVLLQTVFDKQGYSQSALQFEFSSGLSFGNNGSFVIKNTGDIVYGRVPGSVDGRRYLTFADTFVCQLALNRRTGPGLYQRGVVALQLTGDFFSCNGIATPDGSGIGNIMNMLVLYPSVVVRIPNLIPVDCAGGFTYNIPVAAGLNMAPSQSIVFSGYVSALLFGLEIQKGPRWVPLYFNRLVATASYNFSLNHSGGGVNPFNVPSKLLEPSALSYDDYIRLTVALQCTPNTGAMANPDIMGTFGISLDVHPRKEKGAGFMTVSMATSLNF